MSILVNFYYANQPDTLDGKDLPILGPQTDDGEVIADDDSLAATKDVAHLVLITALTDSWVRIGGTAVINQCEKWDAGKEDVRYLPAGTDIFCIAQV